MGPWGIFLSLPVPDAHRSANLVSVVSLVLLSPEVFMFCIPAACTVGPGSSSLAESASALERRVPKAAGVPAGLRSQVLLMGSVVGPRGMTPAPPDSP